MRIPLGTLALAAFVSFGAASSASGQGALVLANAMDPAYSHVFYPNIQAPSYVTRGLSPHRAMAYDVETFGPGFRDPYFRPHPGGVYASYYSRYWR